jgi:pimeloyl-ACP methyl ester carboxylesterase
MTDVTAAASTRSTVRSTDGTPIAYDSLGVGEGVIVVGGVLRTGRDYLPFARVLAESFAVHVLDRRGRGASGPQGPDYSIDKELEDLLAVQAATGATAVFGHSYGGLIALETARRTAVFPQVAVYEPGVSVDGSLRVGWMPRYRELLAAGDTRGAFASMVRQSGFAPSPIARMPLRYVRLILRLVISQRRWRQMEPLLEANLAEHEQVTRLDDGTVDRYASITAKVLLLGGRKSPPFIMTDLFDVLSRTIPDSAVEIIDGLDHTAPDEKAPQLVAERVRRCLCLR